MINPFKIANQLDKFNHDLLKKDLGGYIKRNQVKPFLVTCLSQFSDYLFRIIKKPANDIKLD